MPTHGIEFQELAAAELRAAMCWYAEQRPTVAHSFAAEFERAIQMIAESPERWPPYLAGTRRFLLRRFPFSIVYCERGTIVHILAVAHAKRRPGYWNARNESP